MIRLGMGWAQPLFYTGLALAVVAQIIAYWTGLHKISRFVGMLCGIAAALMIAEAGQIASSYLKAVATMQMGGGLY